MSNEAKQADPTPGLVNAIISGMQEKKGERIVSLNMKGIENAVSDHFIICHGNSDTQVEAIAEAIEEKTLEELNEKPWHI